MTDAYVNDRNTNPSWSYDADGRVLYNPDASYSYDAAGRIITIAVDSTTNQVFDADGQRVKTAETTFNEETWAYETETKYYLRSSVLAEVVSELDAQGLKSRTYVYAGGSVLGWQKRIGSYESVVWEHRDASGASLRTSDTSGRAAYGVRQELDPVGADSGISPPLINNPPPDEGNGGSLLAYPSSFNPARQTSGYSIDGIPVPADYLMQMQAMGAAVECPNNDCGPRWNPNQQTHEGAHGVYQMSGGHYEFFIATIGHHDQIYSGYMPAGIHNEEVSSWFLNRNSSGFLPQRDHAGANDNPLNEKTIDNLLDGLKKFLSNSECGKYINALLDKLPDKLASTEKFAGSLIDVFNLIKGRGGFQIGDTGRAAAKTNPNTMTMTFDRQKSAPNLDGTSSSQRFGITAIVIHELIHVYTANANLGAYGHFDMAIAAREAADAIGIDVKKEVMLSFPTPDVYGTGDAYDLALNDYHDRVLAYACRKVKL